MQLIPRIKKMILSADGSKKVIGNFVLDNQRILNKYTVEQISEATYTSKATVVRFAHYFGFDGWRGFIQQFMKEINYINQNADNVDVNYPFKDNDSIDEIINQMKNLHIQSINDSAELLDTEVLKKATKILNTSKQIVIFAASPNNYLARTFQRKMLSIGRHIEIVSNGEMGLMAGSMSNNDCAIVISYSGSINSAAVEHIRLLELSKTPIIAITSNSDSYLSKHSKTVLKISSHERMYTKIENFATEVSIIYLLNLLFSLYFQIDYDENKQYRLNSSSILENERNNDELEK